MYTAKVQSIEPVRHQASNTEMLEVVFDIMSEGEAVATRRIAIELDTPEEEFEAELVKACTTFQSDEEARVRDEAEQARLANANALKERFVGEEVGPEEE
jgi:hypothetical protein